MDFESRIKATLGELVFADIRNTAIIAQLHAENAELKAKTGPTPPAENAELEAKTGPTPLKKDKAA